MTPPTFVLSIAAKRSCFWTWEFLYISSKTRLALIEWSLEIIPRPVQGASSKTLSNLLGNTYGYLRPSLHVTTVFVIPSL